MTPGPQTIFAVATMPGAQCTVPPLTPPSTVRVRGVFTPARQTPRVIAAAQRTPPPGGTPALAGVRGLERTQTMAAPVSMQFSGHTLSRQSLVPTMGMQVPGVAHYPPTTAYPVGMQSLEPTPYQLNMPHHVAMPFPPGVSPHPNMPPIWGMQVQGPVLLSGGRPFLGMPPPSPPAHLQPFGMVRSLGSCFYPPCSSLPTGLHLRLWWK